MLTNKKAVIFDMDGTMLDSMGVWSFIDFDFFNENKFDVDYDIIKKDIEGCSMYETALYFINRFNMKETPEELMDTWNDMAFHHYENLIETKPGLCDFVDHLKANNIKLGVASSNCRLLIETGLKAHDLLDKMDSIVTSGEVNKSKPEPDVYLAVAKQLEVDPKDCLVFEDVMAGVMAGKNAGMTTCVIYDDYSKDDWNEKCDMADYNIHEYYEVFKN